MITTYSVLPVNTLEGNWVEKKRQCSPSNTSLSIHFEERVSKTPFPRVGNPPVFHAAWIFWDQKCVEFSSELNGSVERSL